MTLIAPQAKAHIRGLALHFKELGRTEAVTNLRRAVAAAQVAIDTAPAKGVPAPPPYPLLAEPGRLWQKHGRYWFVYVVIPRHAIVGVFYETADIPNRLRS